MTLQKYGKHDWEAVRKDYVEGVFDEHGDLRFPKLSDIAEKHGISESTVRKQSARKSWAEERRKFRTDLELERRDINIRNLAGKAAELDAGVFRVTEIALDHIKQHFIKANEKMVKDKKNMQPMTQGQLDVLSKALERYQRIGRLALGEPTDIKESTGDDKNDRYYLIQTLVNDPDIATRIEENFERRNAKDQVRENPFTEDH